MLSETSCFFGLTGLPRLLRKLALLAMTASLLSACGTKPPVQWVSLPVPAPAPSNEQLSDTARAAAALQYDLRPVLVVRRVNVPEYMQSASVRYRQSDSVLREWPDARWADRLEVSLTEHLVMRLRTQLPGWTVCERQCPPDSSAITLNLDLAPFDYLRAAHALQAEARWAFTQRARGAKTPEVAGADLASNRTSHGMKAFKVQTRTDDAPGQAMAMGELLDELARDLAREALAWSGP